MYGEFEVMRTPGSPETLSAYGARVDQTAQMMRAIADMIDDFTQGRVVGEGFSVAAIRRHAGDNARLLRAAADMFDAGGRAHTGYADALFMNALQTQAMIMPINAARAALKAAQAAAAAAAGTPEQAAAEAAVRAAEEELKALHERFDDLVRLNHSSQDSYANVLTDCTAEFVDELGSIGQFSDAANLAAGVAALAGVMALIFGGPLGAVAYGAGAVSAAMMAKLWLSGERSTTDLVLEAVGIVPFGLLAVEGVQAGARLVDLLQGLPVSPGVIAQLDGLGLLRHLPTELADDGLRLLDGPFGGLEAAAVVPGAAGASRLPSGVPRVSTTAYGIPVVEGLVRSNAPSPVLAPAAAKVMQRESAELAAQARHAVDSAKIFRPRLGAPATPDLPTELRRNPLRGYDEVVADISVERIVAQRSALTPEQLGDARVDPTALDYWGQTRGHSMVTGPVMTDSMPSLTGLTNKGTLIDGVLPEQLRPFVHGPDSPVIVEPGRLRLREEIVIHVPEPRNGAGLAELQRQYDIYETANNNNSVRDLIQQAENYQGKNRLDPHSSWKKNIIDATGLDERRRAEALAASEGRELTRAQAEAIQQQAAAAKRNEFASQSGLHSPDQFFGGSGHNVTGWGTQDGNRAISQHLQNVRGEYTSRLRSILSDGGVPPELWDDIRPRLRFEIDRGLSHSYIEPRP